MMGNESRSVNEWNNSTRSFLQEMKPGICRCLSLLLVGWGLMTVIYQLTLRTGKVQLSQEAPLLLWPTSETVTRETIPSTAHSTSSRSSLVLPQNPPFEAAISIVAIPPFVVPDIVHFLFFVTDDEHPLSFINFVSILSAHRIQKPQLLMLHCNHLPAGKWWRRLQRIVPLKIVHREPPQTIFNQSLGHYFHAADVAKLQLMDTYGGIYLDMDVIVVNSLDPLRLHNATMGKEKPPKLIAGIMVGARGAEFFRLVLESYRDDYRSDDWDYNCAKRPYEIYLQHRDLLNVETYKLTTPDYLERHLLLREIMNWRDLYVVHIMAHVLGGTEFDRPEKIRTLQTTLGEVMRYIYYGSPYALPDDKGDRGNNGHDDNDHHEIDYDVSDYDDDDHDDNGHENNYNGTKLP